MWPGATSDLTAYSQTKLYQLVKDGKLPDWAIILMDQIYSSLGGQHLTPFGKQDLERVKRVNKPLYLKMSVFNHLLCSMRVTVERALGQLVRRFLLIASVIEVSYTRVPLLATTCAVLHNIGVERWLADGKPGRGVYGPEAYELIDVGGPCAN